MSDIVKTLSAEEIVKAQQQAQQVASSIKSIVAKNTFVFFAAFDGTNNDRSNLSLSDTRQSTAVGLLEQQVRNTDNIKSRYYEGLGTEGTLPSSTLLPGAVTAQVLDTAERAYREFKEAAQDWLVANPSGEVSVMSVSFSRGGATDVAFKQLVYERGLETADRRVLIAPGNVKFGPSLMIDPVFTGVFGNAALPPGAADFTTVVRAENEQRSAFKAADFNDPKVTIVNVVGNHGDSGAFYDSGLAGIYLQQYAEFFRKANIVLGSLPDDRTYHGTESVDVHAESSTYGLPWITYEGPRQTDAVGRPALAQRFDDGSELFVFDDLKGNRVYSVKSAEGKWTDVDFAKASQVSRVELQGEAALAGLDLIDAVRHHNNAGTASAVIRITEIARRSADLAPLPELQAAGGALMLLGAIDGLQVGNDAQKFVNAARLVLGANEVAKAFNDGKGFLDSGGGFNTLNVVGGVVALASLEGTVKSGNPFAIASSVMAITNSAVALNLIGQSAAFGPQAMIAVAIASIVFGGLFGGSVHYPSPPPAGHIEVGALSDGTVGLLIKDSNGNTYQSRNITGEIVSNPGRGTDSQNWMLGADVLAGRMVGMIADLQAQATKDGSKLVLERLPSIEVHAFPSFDRNGVDNFFCAVRFNDPHTGAEQMMAMAQQDLAKQFKEIAGYADALVDPTELAQIALKKAEGDAYATETEGQYVDRLSGPNEADSLLTKAQLAAQQAANRETYSLLTLDLGGDGITRKAQQSAGMKLEDMQADTTKSISRIDVDNDGFMELTQWVGAKEAILGIDRNGDGQLSSANELFTGGNLSDAAEGLGLKRLVFLDANKDGKLDALDPYFKSLKLWLDINGDARTGVGEVYGMEDAGVRSINVTSGAVTFADNQILALQTTQLTADALGVSVYAATDASGKVVVGQYVLQQEGRDAELNLTADASQDLGEILNLVRPNTNLSDAERTRLTALATKYGVDLSNPAALLALGGGGNVAGTPGSTTVLAGDVFTVSQAPNAAEVKKALEAFFGLVSQNPDAGPLLANHVLVGAEDTLFKIKSADLLAGLSGVTLFSVQDARRGVVSRDLNGDVLFNPGADQSGTAYFSYTAKDTTGKQSTGMVWLNIAEVNDAPVAVADSFSVLEDTPLALNAAQLLANDSDADIANNANERLRVSNVGNAQHGTVQLINGQVVFNAEADYQGAASFEYTVSDVAGASSTATASVTVVGVNDVPVSAGKVGKLLAKPDTLLRIEAQTLLDYVRDADIVYGDAVRLSSIVSISSGKAWQQKDGSVLFKASALGDTVLTVQVSDSQGAVVVVPITISVATDNTAAAALLPGPDQASEDTVVRIASTQTIVAVVSTQNGSTSLDSNGTLVFAPTANFNGAAQVVYRVRNADGSTEQKALDFSVAAVNDAPIVVKPLATQTVAEDGVLTVAAATLLSTVDDVDIRTNGQRLRVSSVGDATNGRVMLNTNGDVVFSPNKDFNGNATFRYWVMDDAGASVGAWANVIVTPVNDAPTPLAQSISILEDEVRTFSTAALIANAALVDVDTVTNADVLKIKSVAMAVGSEQKGSVLLDSNGNVRFTPTANYNGQAVFVYTVADAAGATGSNTFTLNIAPVNDAPTALTPNLRLSGGTEDTVKTIAFADLVKAFTDVDGDALNVRSVTSSFGGQATIQNGKVLFTPNKDFAGDAIFSFTVADPSGAIASSNATVNFANVNDAPVAAYKRIDGRALEDVQMRINFSELTSGAFDADGDPVTVQSVSPVSNGNAWIDWAAQQVVFQGASNFNGVARFNYTLADPGGATSTQAVDVGVIAVNDNPTVRAVTGFTVAEDGYYSNNQDPNANAWIRISNFMGNVAAGDVDGDGLNFGDFSNLRHIAEIYRDGNDLMLKFQQNYNTDYASWTNDSAGFNYRVNDGKGGYADGQVDFNVQGQNDRPWLVGLDGWPGAGANLSGNFSARIYGYDVDSPGSALGAGIGTSPIHGDLSLTPTVLPPGKWGPGGALPAAWDTAYNSHYGDEFSGRVGMNIDVWDGQGGWARQYIETYHSGSRASSGGKPVAIDLNGDGISYKNLDDSKVLFDINGDGVKDLLAWTAADDGLIVFDKNGDGIIQDLDEVSFLSYLTGSMTDLEGLNGFDTNKDGKLSAADAMWSKFGVWQDKNQNGVTDAGEFKGLEAWNIRSIELTSDQRMDQVGDVYILGKSTFERTDGSKGEIADTAFRYIDGADTSPNSKPKTFNIDIESVIRKRLEDAHNHGASDDELRSMLQKFIADVASAGSKPVDVAASEAVAWSLAMYANPTLAEQLIQQQHTAA